MDRETSTTKRKESKEKLIAAINKRPEAVKNQAHPNPEVTLHSIIQVSDFRL